jgi:hypothetical protein
MQCTMLGCSFLSAARTCRQALIVTDQPSMTDHPVQPAIEPTPDQRRSSRDQRPGGRSAPSSAPACGPAACRSSATPARKRQPSTRRCGAGRGSEHPSILPAPGRVARRVSPQNICICESVNSRKVVSKNCRMLSAAGASCLSR